MEKQFKQEVALPLESCKEQIVGSNIQESEQKYRLIFDQSMDGLLLWDNEHFIIDVNRAGEKMIGVTKRKLIGSRVYDPHTIQEEGKQEILRHIDDLLQNGKIDSTILCFEVEEGSKKYFECSSQLDICAGVNLTVFKDVTEKIEMQEQLRKSDTLTVIGELAAGIAHEIRNPLTALKGFIQLLESSLMKEHAMYYQVITSELQRIDSIINEFLLLAKPQAIRYQEKDISKIMKETVDLLTAQAVLHNIQFVTIYDNQLPLVFCEPNQLKKVFINLIKNAIEVMPNGGDITINIRKKGDQLIQISIKDEGTGIEKEKIKKLGEPFYTTKDSGTGLGLMVSYRIIAEHKGTISIESEEGRGTIFTLELPIT